MPELKLHARSGRRDKNRRIGWRLQRANREPPRCNMANLSYLTLKNVSWSMQRYLQGRGKISSGRSCLVSIAISCWSVVQAAQVSSYTDVIVCGTDYVQFMGNLFGKLPVCLPDYGSCASKLYYQSECVPTTPIMFRDFLKIEMIVVNLVLNNLKLPNCCVSEKCG
jgi:hypothetical protein